MENDNGVDVVKSPLDLIIVNAVYESITPVLAGMVEKKRGVIVYAYIWRFVSIFFYIAEIEKG